LAARREPVDDVMKSLDKLFQPWNRSDAPGLIVGVAHKGATIYRRGFGPASVEPATANTPQTKMPIGSTSQHFTSLARLPLAQTGPAALHPHRPTRLPAHA